jgi:putative ABC transport system permease protein
VYGAMAFSVVQRRRELAVRAALGAGKRELFRLVLVRAVRLSAIGICVGAAFALALSRFLSAILFGIGERDPIAFVAAIATLGTVAIAASMLPARAASRLDPMTILRRE